MLTPSPPPSTVDPQRVVFYGYSLGETEPRLSLFEYPDYDFQVTGEMTNLQVEPG